MPQSDTTRQRFAGAPRLTQLRGTVVPLVTPVDAEHRVCEQSVVRLLDSLRGSVDGYMPALSTGEGWKLSLKQWIDMVHLTVAHADGAPVLAGVEVGGTEQILTRAVLAEALGADAIVVPPPFPVEGRPRPTLVEHFKEIVDESPLPVVVYHENAVSKMELDLAQLREVLSLPGVVGVKESSGDVQFTKELLADEVPVPVFQGWEHQIADVPGVQGFVGPLANLDPRACQAAVTYFSAESQERVNALSEQYQLLADDWYLHVKAELVRRGVITTALPVD
ncbi:dihydrodipicolinate synthase family protein [Streptomyces sp. NPDC087440]|uniref:dihydrodipicolinate synthase family protein n=1 Tax=Streptomyces sp. NPDC087440 TaxID=3365790 RepID=UPI003805DB10